MIQKLSPVPTTQISCGKQNKSPFCRWTPSKTEMMHGPPTIYMIENTILAWKIEKNYLGT